MAANTNNVTLESLKKTHGDKAEAAFREIAEVGGFGNVPVDYYGGLDVGGVLADDNTALSKAEKDRISKIIKGDK